MKKLILLFLLSYSSYAQNNVSFSTNIIGWAVNLKNFGITWDSKDKFFQKNHLEFSFGNLIRNSSTSNDNFIFNSISFSKRYYESTKNSNLGIFLAPKTRIVYRDIYMQGQEWLFTPIIPEIDYEMAGIAIGTDIGFTKKIKDKLILEPIMGFSAGIPIYKYDFPRNLFFDFKVGISVGINLQMRKNHQKNPLK